MPTGSLTTEIDIDAPPEAVWSVLADTASYPDWNPFILYFEGELKAGGKMKMTAKPPGKSGGTFTPTLLAGERGATVAARPRPALPHLLDARRAASLVPAGTPRFI